MPEVERDRRNPQYLLALEVTNLRLAVELARSAMRLGRWHEALEHLESVEAPGRRAEATANGHDSSRPLTSVGPAVGSWRHTRPSLLVQVVRDLTDEQLEDEEQRELLLDLMQQRDADLERDYLERDVG